MTTYTAEHLSGRYDVDPSVLRAALVKQLADDPDFVSHTEMGRNARAAVLHDFPAYDVIQFEGLDGRDECALQYRAGRKVIASRAIKLSELPIPRRGGKFCFALYVRFEDHHRIILHMPSGVEGTHGFLDNAQARVYRASIGGLKQLVATLDGPVVITGDWNLNLRKGWVRSYLAEAFPRFSTTWLVSNLPELGTHGARVIDYSLIRGFSVTAANVVPAFGASDHRGVRETHTRKETPVTSVIEQLRAAGVECFTRTQWGSPREADGSYARRRNTHPMPAGPASYHFLHISVTGDTDTVQEGAAGARQIETYGYSTPPMVSYQDLVTNEGRYFQGQDYGTKGTHTVNDLDVPGFPHDLNLHGYACALMQNVGDQVTDDQVRVVAMVFAARELAGLVKRGAPIFPHRKFAPKSCPGDKAMARLDEIEALKAKYVRDGLPRPTSPLEDEVTPDELRTIVREEIANAKINVGDGVMLNDDTVARRILASLERIETALKEG